MKKNARILLILFLIVVGAYFTITGLIAAKAFLAPLAIAILLSMLVLPLAQKFEKWGLGRGLASLFSALLLVLASLVFFFVISAQVKLVVDDWDKIVNKVSPKIESSLSYIEKKTGFTAGEAFKLPPALASVSQADSTSGNNKSGEQRQNGKSTASSFSGKELMMGVASSAMNIFSFFGTMLLVFIYVFFFLNYRTKLQKSLLKMVADDQQKRTSKIVQQSVNVAKSYIVGKFTLILFLSVFYSVGMLLLGVQYAIFVGVIAAFLSLIPYIGNLIGGALAVLFTFVSGGSLVIVLAVIGIFVLAQFVESYLLEPYVVGKQVELNPIMIIIMVIAGESIWGITGMVIAIPVSGILKVLFDAIPVTSPIGYLLGDEDISNGGIFKKIEQRIKAWFN